MPHLAKGGQGTVYKARTKQRSKNVEESRLRISDLIRQISSQFNKPEEVEELARRLYDFATPDNHQSLGALKVFDLPTEPEERTRAINRLQAEIRALKELSHPAILQLLDASHLSSEKQFIVTEFHPGGPLSNHLDRFKGKPLEALRALKPLVDAVADIHAHGAIHRDIKTKNIFIARDGHLVLGDFGIVFFHDLADNRPTSTYERVGTRDWMAPWAHLNLRLELAKVNPKLDVFPLAKVLWSMIAGQDGFAAWDYDHRENDLRLRFPDDPFMDAVNLLLSKCIVRDEENCLGSATELGAMVDLLIEQFIQSGNGPIGSKPWPCRMCGKGKYVRDQYKSVQQYSYENGGIAGGALVFRYVCEHCGHIEFFAKEPTSLGDAIKGQLKLDATPSPKIEAEYQPEIRIKGPGLLTLSIYPDADRYLFKFENHDLDDKSNLSLASIEYRTFDIDHMDFRPPRAMAAHFGTAKSVLAADESQEFVFAHFPNGLFQFTNTNGSAVPQWPRGDSNEIRRWRFSFKVTGGATDWPIELLIRSQTGTKILAFQLYRSDIPLKAI